MAHILNSTTKVLTVFHDNKVIKFSVEHPFYRAAVDAVKAGDYAKVMSLSDTKTAVQNWSGGTIEVLEDKVMYGGRELHNTIVPRILESLKQGFDVKPLINFLDKLMQNPDSRAVEEGYKFLEHLGLPINAEGNVIATKSVREDYYSKTSGSLALLQGKSNAEGRIFNGVGEVVECVRNQVDSRCENHCSHGLHVGSWEYAGRGGTFNSPNDRVMMVEFSPANMVSVPTDHSFTKLRVCAYKVVGEAKDGPVQKPVYTGTDEDYEEYDDEQYEDYDWVEEGNEYSFEYEGKTRHALVDVWNEDHITCRLISPERDAGGVRRFNKEKMMDIVLMTDNSNE